MKKQNQLNRVLLQNNQETFEYISAQLVRKFYKHVNSDKNYPISGNNPKTERFSTTGMPIEKLLDTIDKRIFDTAIYKSKQSYLAFIDNGTNGINFPTAVINSLLNQNMTCHLTDSPGATPIEISTILEIRRMIGYDITDEVKELGNVGGCFVSGGMMANMTAILIERNKLFENCQQKGLPDKKPKLIIPDATAHYSHWNAMGWLGFGEENVVRVKTKGFHYDLDALEEIILQLESQNQPILGVVVICGDSYSMTIDNIPKVHDICKKHGLWLHGDAAAGGALIFSKKYRNKINGIELCNSITLDPHKSMGMSYPSSLFLCKNPKDFNTIISYWNIVNKKGSFDLGIISPFLNSRGFDSLRIWLMFKAFGTDGVSKMVDNKIDSTMKIYSEMKKVSSNIIFWNEPETFSILFQIVPKTIDISSIVDNESILVELDMHQGKFREELDRNTGIKINSFTLPVKLRFPFNDSRQKFSTVLCLHNAHEQVNSKIIENLVKEIERYCRNN
jgi:glutamate/tyrosine decarboxylase-like PLP-dependent enzyme